MRGEWKEWDPYREYIANYYSSSSTWLYIDLNAALYREYYDQKFADKRVNWKKGKKNYEACCNGFFSTQQRPFITHNLIGAIILDEMIRKRFLSLKIAEYLLKSPKNAITSTTSHATSLSMTTLSPNMFIRQPIVILSSTFFNPFFALVSSSIFHPSTQPDNYFKFLILSL